MSNDPLDTAGSADAPPPQWISRYFPDVRDLKRVGPNRYQGVADPMHGTDLDHVLIMCDPDEKRFVTRRIADYALERTTFDILDWSWRKLEAKLASDLAKEASMSSESPSQADIVFKPDDQPRWSVDHVIATWTATAPPAVNEIVHLGPQEIAYRVIRFWRPESDSPLFAYVQPIAAEE